MTRAVVVTRDAYRTEEMKRIGLAARKNSVELIVVDPTRTSLDIGSGLPLDRRGRPIDFDVVLGRVDADCLEAGSLFLELMEGTRPVINGAKTFRTGRDKRAMSRALARAQIPHPPVWSLTPQDALRLARQLPYPLVVKPRGAPWAGALPSLESRAVWPSWPRRRKTLFTSRRTARSAKSSACWSWTAVCWGRSAAFPGPVSGGPTWP